MTNCGHSQDNFELHFKVSLLEIVLLISATKSRGNILQHWQRPFIINNLHLSDTWVDAKNPLRHFSHQIKDLSWCTVDVLAKIVQNYCWQSSKVYMMLYNMCKLENKNLTMENFNCLFGKILEKQENPLPINIICTFI